MTRILPDIARTGHTAVIGKTGSGKTSTAKVIVEDEVELGSRVCILDPVKSDWWGLTSSADGNKPGLPFYILGGPRGHLPLHESSGKEIGELVASGALPLSILDMRFFKAGGHQQFFVDFAETLTREMRGVLYLVIEEAHLFAPKERVGIGAENMAVHWAKTLATAGRSMGIRLILATQRTQALHNALLGSCDTMIAHRFTAPADQKPIIDWLKANTKDKALRVQIEDSLSDLATGQGWLASSEAKVFELVSFPRIKTFDNTATPTDDDEVRQVATASVDLDRLRAVVGDAVKQAEEDDPKFLRKRISELERQGAGKTTAGAPDQQAIVHAEARGFNRGREAGYRESLTRTGNKVLELHEFTERWMNDLESIAAGAWIKDPVQFGVDLASGNDVHTEVLVAAGRVVDVKTRPSRRAPAKAPVSQHAKVAGPKPARSRGVNQLIEVLVRSYPVPLSPELWGALAGSSPNGGWWNSQIKAYREEGLVVFEGGRFTATDKAIASADEPPAGAKDEVDLWGLWRDVVADRVGSAGMVLLTVLAEHRKFRLTIEQWSLLANRAPTGGWWNAALKSLRDWECIDRSDDRHGVTPKGFALVKDALHAVGAGGTQDAIKSARKAKMPASAQKLLDTLREGMTRAELSAAAGMKQSGGYWNAAIKSLVESGLVAEAGGRISRVPEALVKA